MKSNDYFEFIEKEVYRNYNIANDARAKGLDPVDKVEIPLAKNLAEKSIGLISTLYPQINNPEITKRIAELEKEYGLLDVGVCLKIAEEIAQEKFCKFESKLQAIEAGIRVGFAYTTLGVVSSPIEGFTFLKVGKTKDGKEYFMPYFSGPIRSAGTTASCVVLIIIDHLREIFGYAKFDPSEIEVKRTVTEILDFHERITNLQYCPTEEEAIFIAQNLPIQVAGEPSEKLEVSNYKDLERVDTNFLRSGFCLILAEGLAQKAPKALRILKGLRKNGFKLSDWDFLEEYCKIHEKRTLGKSDGAPTYMKDLVAGRPIFGHPSRSGSFRFRYGRSRVSGFSAASVHPATMAISNNFLATGTQLKIEKPTKGCIITPCDSIDGPIVKLKNDEVVYVDNFDEAKRIYKDVKEIIYFGDILFPFGDIANRNHNLIKQGYVEEWWYLELKKLNKNVDDFMNVDFETAYNLSKDFRIPFYPKYIFYWSQIKFDEFLELLRWFSYGRINKKLILPYSHISKEKFKVGKRALELLGIPHKISVENVILSEVNTKSLFVNLGLDLNLLEKEDYIIEKEINEILEKSMSLKDKDVLTIVDFLSEFIIKDKAGDFIGTRMGRPEKAKLRKLTGNPHSLFPIGEEGGRFRSVNEAVSLGYVNSEFPNYFCEKCNNQTIYRVCENCGGKTNLKSYCFRCKDFIEGDKCSIHEMGSKYSRKKLDVKKYFDLAKKTLNYSNGEIPVLIKGVRGLSSESNAVENLAKGILRAKYNLNVNKDGTIRYDMTEIPITHFKPKEVGVNIKKLIELGYDKDIKGLPLENEEQVLELMAHDIILPSNSESGDEKAEDVFMNLANFIDEMLERFYGLPKFYNLKTKEDLIGHLGVCMAPHNCAGVISRIIGFSKTQGLIASPYMHAAMRRDCFDYDTFISIKEGNLWKNVKIGDFVEKIKLLKKVDNFGTLEKRVDNIKTVGFESSIKEVKVNNFTKHQERDIFEIKTSLGKKLIVTENHKFLIDNKIKTTSNLKIGDKIPLPIKINIGENNLSEINLAVELKNENMMIRNINNILNNYEVDYEGILKKLNISKKQFQNFKIRDSYPIDFVFELKSDLQNKIFDCGYISSKRDNVLIPIKIKLTKEILELIGLYIAEGFSRSVSGKKGLNQVYISSNDNYLRDFIKKTISDSFNLKPSENKQDRVTYSSKVFYLFFNKVLECGSCAGEKRIPNRFLDLPLNKLACVLRGYFEGDGCAEKNRKKVSCDSVSEGLLFDLEFCLSRFGIFCKRYEYEKEPGNLLKEFYVSKNKVVPKFRITKLIIGSDFVERFLQIGFLSEKKNNILKNYKKINAYGMRIDYDSNFVYDPVISINYLGKRRSYCLNVDTKNHLISANSIISRQCDGDEAAAMLLLDVLINFSKKYLPSHRGGTQDAPLVLNGRIVASEVDDQILDFDIVSSYPLELYEKSEKRVHSSEIDIEMVKQRVNQGLDPYSNIGYTHETSDINSGILCSSYKQIPTMQEKVDMEMELVNKLRCVDASDVARLIIERHFIRDIRGNLRKFSMQGFRCVKCNSKFRRPPLSGKCSTCGGKIIFTISEGGIVKYLEPALKLANNYDIPVYVKQNIELTKKYIESIFGKEETKQVDLGNWF